MAVFVYLLGISFSSLLCMGSYAWLAFSIYSFIKAKKNPAVFSDTQIKTRLALMIASICAVVFALTVLSVVTFMYAMKFVV